jgi:hypothetical protein
MLDTAATILMAPISGGAQSRPTSRISDRAPHLRRNAADLDAGMTVWNVHFVVIQIAACGCWAAPLARRYLPTGNACDLTSVVPHIQVCGEAVVINGALGKCAREMVGVLISGPVARRLETTFNDGS